MITNRLSIILIILITSLSAFSQQTSHPQVIQYQLENGLTVILNPDPLAKDVMGIVVTRVGSKDDPATATGLAHYMEHMLFKGTPEIGTSNYLAEKEHLDNIVQLYDQLAVTTDPAQRKEIQTKINDESLKANDYVINNEMWSLIMELGGTNLNAGTGSDATFFYNSFPAGQMENWLELYSHRFINPVFRGFQAELEVVYEEKNMYSDQFFSTLLEQFNKNFFKNHPYGQQTTIGTIEHLKNPQLSKMIQFYNTWYVANNMALILSGNFSVDETRPVIEEKFSRLKSGELPKRPVYQEEAFKGREFVSGRYSPINLGLLGFRTVPKMHEDRIGLDVANSVLTNGSSTGLLDRLMLDNQIMVASVFDMPYQEHGATIFLFIPKIFRQSNEKAETLVLSEIKKLKEGQFDEKLLDAIKLEKYVDFQSGLEDNSNRAMMLAEAFVNGENIEDMFAYPQKIMAISKDDVISLANKYYGDNFLAFHSKIGIQKPKKIEKPGFKPVISTQESHSAYADQIRNNPSKEINFQLIDFERDINTIELKPGISLYSVKNPVNDIFNLTIRYLTGSRNIRELPYLASALMYSGTNKKPAVTYKTEFGLLGCSYGFSSSESYFDISLSGPEKNLDSALVLLGELLAAPDFNDNAVGKLLEDEKTNRKFERSEPQSISDALFEYVKYGNQSGYLTRMTMEEIAAIDRPALENCLKKILEYQSELHFSGNTDPESLKNSITEALYFPESGISGTAPYYEPVKEYPENTVFFTHNKKAIQSNIQFLLAGDPFNIELVPQIAAYNTYFGGSFSGIVLQEIREFRSLSYSASGYYHSMEKPGFRTYYTGYVGTQADKTEEALQVYSDILKNMPQKPERMNMIKNYLSLSLQTSRPGFRELSFTVRNWKQKGYKEDPINQLLGQYKNLQFNDIVEFQESYIKPKPLIITIVANKKLVEQDMLSKFGKVLNIKEKELFSK